MSLRDFGLEHTQKGTVTVGITLQNIVIFSLHKEIFTFNLLFR